MQADLTEFYGDVAGITELAAGLVSKPSSEVEEEGVGGHSDIECRPVLRSAVASYALAAHGLPNGRQPGRAAQSTAPSRRDQPRSKLPARRRRRVLPAHDPARRRRRQPMRSYRRRRADVDGGSVRPGRATVRERHDACLDTLLRQRPDPQRRFSGSSRCRGVPAAPRPYVATCFRS